MGCSKNISKKEVYSDTNLLHETGKTSSKQSNFTPKGTRKRRKKKGQSQQKEENNKNENKNRDIKKQKNSMTNMGRRPK